MQETELYEVLSDWCDSNGLDIWGEVTNRARREGNTADAVVGVFKHVYISIELKNSLNLTVLGQASLNKIYYNASCIGVPAVQSHDVGRKFAYNLIRERGMGLIEFYPKTDGGFILPDRDIFTIKPKISVRPTDGRRDCSKWITEENRHIVGGSQNGRSTMWIKAMEDVKILLKANGVATLIDLFDPVKEYFKHPKNLYRTLRGFAKWARCYSVEGEIFFEYVDEQ